MSENENTKNHPYSYEEVVDDFIENEKDIIACEMIIERKMSSLLRTAVIILRELIITRDVMIVYFSKRGWEIPIVTSNIEVKMSVVK
jgi:hypothetical protein